MSQTGVSQAEISESADNFERDVVEVPAGASFTVPVLSETLEVRKEPFRTGTVRLHKLVHELPEVISEVLASETIDIERIPMDVLVDAPPPVRVEGNVTVISIVEEVLVVTKQLRVKEELRIIRRQAVSNFYQEVGLRSEEVVVERVESDTPTQI